MSADSPEAADPRAAYSYRHPASGEWAHPRHGGPLEDAERNYVAPAWEILGARLLAHPQGPPGADRGWRALVIGFGRGFEAVALLRARERDAPAARLRVTGLEPHPELLEPWPARWRELGAEEAPWWGQPPGLWESAAGLCQIEVRTRRAQDWLDAQAPRSLDFLILDLFSPGRAAEDWEPLLFPLLARAASPAAVLTTYCCARRVRDGLAAAGWQVEILRRPGGRDSLRAIRSPVTPP